MSDLAWPIIGVLLLAWVLLGLYVGGLFHRMWLRFGRQWRCCGNCAYAASLGGRWGADTYTECQHARHRYPIVAWWGWCAEWTRKREVQP
jgi:hypothetical protein